MQTKYWPGFIAGKISNGRMMSFSNVVIVYEDLEMGKLASWLCHSLAKEFKVDGELSQELWNFQVLDVAEIHEQAICVAARADLIVISTHGYEELPVEVSSWIEGWVKRRQNHPGTLVALFDELHPPPGARAVIETYLRGVARRGGLEFLIPVSPAAEDQPEFAFSIVPTPAAGVAARD